MFWSTSPDEILLDNGASTPPFQEVVDEVLKFLSNYGSIHRGFGERSIVSTSKYEEAREKIKSLMKADNDYDLFFVSNTTDGINRVALMLLEEKEKTGRDIIVVSEIEHSANLLPFIPYFKIIQIKTTSNLEPDLSHLEWILKNHSRRILAVSLAGASNVTGRVLDIPAVRELIRLYDESIYFIVDASQYAPHHPIKASYADAWIFSGHKAYAPFGIGGVLAKKKLLSNMKYSFKGGGDVEYIYPDLTPKYKPVPHNQEIGTPNGIGAVAMAKAFEILYEKIGFEQVHKHEKEVFKRLEEVVSKYDFINVLYSNAPIMMVDIDKPKEEIERFFQENKINARMGHFCVFRFIEKLKGIPPLHKEEPIDLSDYLTIRFSVGLPTTVHQINKLDEVFSRWT